MGNQTTIIAEWEKFARTVPIAENMDRAALRDHVVDLLKFIAKDLETHQTAWEQSEKSKGRQDSEDTKDSPGEKHAEQRFTGGFDTVEMLSEFRALRASVIKLWDRDETQTERDFKDLVRFNEAIDQIMTESLARYSEKINDARTLFLGTLMHDLRNPLNAILMSAQFLLHLGNMDNKQIQLISQIEASTGRITNLVSALIDEVRIRLGKGVPLSPAPMNMEEAVHQAVREIRAANPQRRVSLVTAGNLEGQWDNDRIGQMLSNLMGNAIQHGIPEEEISVEAKEIPDGIMISVKNQGVPIPKALLPMIFDPLTRGMGKAQAQSASGSLGLGLFITKGIIEAHGGKIIVESTEAGGTIFTVQLPRAVQPGKTEDEG